MKFEIAVEPEQLAAVGEVADLYAEEAAQWWDASIRLAKEAEGSAGRRQALVELRAERDRRRVTGVHLDTRSAMLAHFVRGEFDRRGWSGRTWRPVPRGEASMPGRRWGVGNDGTLTASLAVHLPDDVGELLRRATWHVSAPATRRLQELAEVWPLTGEGLLERARLRGQVVTTGDVIRAAGAAAVASRS